MGENPEIVEYTRQLAVFTKWLVIATAVLAVTALFVGTIQAIISRNAARRQLRAYVFVDYVRLMDSGQFPELEGMTELQENAPVFPNRPGTEIHIKNSGQTPAYKISHWSAMDVVEVRLEHAIVVPPADPTSPKSYIAAGTFNIMGHWFPRELTQQEIDDIRNHVRGIYVFGRIDYLDVFGKPHFTTYRLRYSGIYPPLRRFVVTYCTTGNETD